MGDLPAGLPQLHHRIEHTAEPRSNRWIRQKIVKNQQTRAAVWRGTIVHVAVMIPRLAAELTAIKVALYTRFHRMHFVGADPRISALFRPGSDSGMSRLAPASRSIDFRSMRRSMSRANQHVFSIDRLSVLRRHVTESDTRLRADIERLGPGTRTSKSRQGCGRTRRCPTTRAIAGLRSNRSSAMSPAKRCSTSGATPDSSRCA